MPISPAAQPEAKRIRRDSPEARAELRARIVDAALSTFLAQGEHAVTMRAIADQVGVSQMTLYGYFEDKAHLLRSTWEFLFSELLESMQAALQHRRTPSTRLHALIDAWLAYWESRPANFRLVYLSGHSTPPEQQRHHFARVGVYQSLTNMVAEAIKEYALEQGLPTTRIGLALDILLCQGLGYLHVTMALARHPRSHTTDLRKAMLDATMQSMRQVLDSRWPLTESDAVI